MYERNYQLVRAKFREFFLPTLLMSMAINISTFVDTLIVGNTLGPVNVSAMALVAPIITFINLIYWMIGLGGSLLSAVAKAERDQEKSDMYFTLSVVILILVGVCFSALGLIFMDNLLATLTNNPQLAYLVERFLGVYFIGSPFLFFMMGIAYFIRADGLPRLSFYALLISNVVNLALDLFYILVLGMDIQGAALATISGYTVGTLFILQYFFRKERTLHFISLFRCKLSLAWDVMKLGFPPASMQLFLTVKLLFINTLILLYAGKPGLTGFSVFYYSLYIIYMFLIGTSQTMSSIVSIYFQERDYQSVWYTLKTSLKIVLLTGVVFTVVLLAFPTFLLQIFGVSNPVDLAVGVNALRILALSITGTAVTFLMLFYTQAIKQEKLSFLISISEGLILPVALAYILSGVMGINGVWLSFFLAEVGPIILIYLASRIISRKSEGELSGFFLRGSYQDVPGLDVSIKNSLDDAVGLSEKLIDFAQENGVEPQVAVRMGLAVEEMAVNIINYNPEKIEYMDILTKIEKDRITIAFKDSGTEFDPSTYTPEEEGSFESMEVLQKIAHDISYAWLIGLNSTVITINRENCK